MKDAEHALQQLFADRVLTVVIAQAWLVLVFSHQYSTEEMLELEGVVKVGMLIFIMPVMIYPWLKGQQMTRDCISSLR